MTTQILKPIREYTNEVLVESIQADSEQGKKKWYIQGVTLQGDIKNRNGRRYPKNMLSEAVNKHIQEKLNSGRALGELNHPKQDFAEINLKEVSHKFTQVQESGSDYITKAVIMDDTPNGKIVCNLLENEVKLGISSRGLGSLNGDKVVENFHIVTFGDIVADPSAPAAFIEGVMESQEWIFENGVIRGKDISEEIDDYQRILKEAKRSEIKQATARIVKDYFSKILG